MNPILEFLDTHDFERTDWVDDIAAPTKGESTAGYRIMYTYTDPESGQKTLFSPLVINRPEITQMEMTAESPYIKTGPDIDMPQFGAQRLEGVHHTDDVSGGLGRQGYYYFSNKDTAEDYMAAILMGTKRVGAKGVGKEAPYELNYVKNTYGDASLETMNKRLSHVSLDMYRVTGVAESNPVDEGYTMNDMVYDTEPELSFNMGTVAEVSNRFRGIELSPEDKAQISERLQRALQYMIKG